MIRADAPRIGMLLTIFVLCTLATLVALVVNWVS